MTSPDTHQAPHPYGPRLLLPHSAASQKGPGGGVARDQVMSPASLPQQVRLPTVELALRALSPPCGKTRHVPRITLSNVRDRRGGREGKVKRWKDASCPPTPRNQPKRHCPGSSSSRISVKFSPPKSNRKDLQPHYGMNCVPTNVHMLNSKPPVTQNVNGLGDRVF